MCVYWGRNSDGEELGRWLKAAISNSRKTDSEEKDKAGDIKPTGWSQRQ